MLGRDRAAELGYGVVDDAVHRRALGDEPLGADVVVDVAVPDVAEGVNAHVRVARGESLGGALDEIGRFGDGHRDIVLHVGELRLGHRLADAPERARLLAALRERRVGERAALGRVHERPFHPLAQSLLFAAVGDLDEHIPRMRPRERVLRAGREGEHRLDAVARQELECAQPLAEPLVQEGEQFHRRRRAGERDPCRGAGARLRMQPQHRRGDDAERAFGAEEKLLEIVARVVLAQAAQSVPDAPVGQHHFEAQHLLARRAIAQHVYAARIGGEVAADLAAAFGGERERKQPSGLIGRPLHIGEHAAGFDGDRIVKAIELADPVHAAEREHDLAAFAGGHRAAREAGVAALGNDRHAVRGAELHHARDFRRTRGPHHAFGAPGVLAPPVCKVRPGILRCSQDVGGAYNVAKHLNHRSFWILLWSAAQRK